jgi:hypothetical protein
VKLTAVADQFEERMPDLSAQMRQSGIAWYRDYREMLASEPALDFVVVAAHVLPRTVELGHEPHFSILGEFLPVARQPRERESREPRSQGATTAAVQTSG